MSHNVHAAVILRYLEELHWTISSTKSPGNGLARKLADVLAVAPQPMLLEEIMCVLVQLRRVGKEEAHTKEREGLGRKVSNAYALRGCQLPFMTI